jgi:hypothetical protein
MTEPRDAPKANHVTKPVAKIVNSFTKYDGRSSACKSRKFEKILNSHMRTKAHASSGCPMRESAYKAVIAQTVQNMVPEYSDQRKERSRIGNFFFVLFVLFILSNRIIRRFSRSDIR